VLHGLHYVLRARRLSGRGLAASQRSVARGAASITETVVLPLLAA
jgi:hypothetical protein